MDNAELSNNCLMFSSLGEPTDYPHCVRKESIQIQSEMLNESNGVHCSSSIVNGSASLDGIQCIGNGGGDGGCYG